MDGIDILNLAAKNKFIFLTNVAQHKAFLMPQDSLPF